MNADDKIKTSGYWKCSTSSPLIRSMLNGMEILKHVNQIVLTQEKYSESSAIYTSHLHWSAAMFMGSVAEFLPSWKMALATPVGFGMVRGG